MSTAGRLYKGCCIVDINQFFAIYILNIIFVCAIVESKGLYTGMSDGRFHCKDTTYQISSVFFILLNDLHAYR